MKQKIIITILAILSIGLLGYIIFDKTNSKEENNKPLEEQEDLIVKDYDLTKAEELLNYFGFNEYVGCSDKIFGYFYNDDFKAIQAIKKVLDSKKSKIKCSELYKDKELHEFGYYKDEDSLGVCYKDEEASLIKYDDLNEIYKKMYGIDAPKKGFSGINIGFMYYYFYGYNEKLNSFVELKCGGCGGACGENFSISKIKSAKEIGDELKIEVFYYIGIPYETEYGKVYNLETSKINKTLDVTNIKDFEKEILNNYLEYLDVYEVVFENKDGNYIFKSLAKKLS